MCSETLPSNNYFCYLMIADSMPDFTSTREKEISESRFDYIITMSDKYEWDNYEIIATADFHAPDRIQITINEQRDFTYYLYALVN